MMISAIFLAILVPALYSLSTINAGILNNTISHGDTKDTADYFQHKFEAFERALNKIDVSMQNLQEKAHNWAILGHHIDSWNDQMKTLEHKLDLVKRTQDEQQTVYGNKLTSLEFTLNHILSKVVYLSDSCHTSMATSKPIEASSNALEEVLRNRQQKADRKVKDEISIRLSNILRHVQKIENDKCRRPASATTTNEADNKMSKIMLPIGGCNASQRHNYNLDQSLKGLEQKLNLLVESNQMRKDLKQIHSLMKNNSKSLDNILSFITKTDVRLIQWQDDSTKSLQAVSSELSTFTESSDILLKRVELISEKINRCKVEKPNHNSSDERRHDDREEDRRDGREDEEESEIETVTELLDVNRTVEVFDEKDLTDTEMNSADEVEFIQPQKIACQELNGLRVNGIYKLSSPELNEAGRDFNERFCDFATAGIAWTVLMNRGPYVEQENFNRSWADYRNGFGSLDKDFWFGNEFTHQLVYRDDYELRVELEDFDGAQAWAEYGIFRVDSERYNYNLLIGGYRGGTVGDALQYHNEMDFSTYDRRNDKSKDACCSCATGYASGWWFDNCSEANLNGVYHDTPTGHNYVGIIWEHWRGDYSLKKARMMVRPLNWSPTIETRHVYSEFSEDP